MDSGAYSFLNSGEKAENRDFITFAAHVRKTDLKLRHIFALDVIGNPEQSLANALEAKAAGLEVIPTWHAGEPIEFAQEMAKHFPRLALGGMVGRVNNDAHLLDPNAKQHHAQKFFHAVWPKWVHGFGISGDDLLSEFPFASCDSTTWSFRPSRYGDWKSFNMHMPLRITKDTKDTLRSEVDWFMDRECFHNAQWRRELDRINEPRFRIRLACSVSNVKDVSRMFCPEESVAIEAEPEEQAALPAAWDDKPAIQLEADKPARKSSELDSEKEYKWKDYWAQRLWDRK